MRRTVWSVSSGEYSDYSVTALYENKADALTMAARHHGYVQEFELYSPGDLSRRRATGWTSTIKVKFDGTVGQPDTQEIRYGEMDDQGLVDERPLELRLGRERAIFVNGYGDTEERAVKGAKDRAAKTASELLDGHDPRDIVRGEDLLDLEIEADWTDALADKARHDQDFARRYKNAQEAADRRASHQQQLELENLTKVALFDGSDQVTDWLPLSDGIAHIPEEYSGDHRTLQLRLEDQTSILQTLAAKVLTTGGMAHIWPTASNPNLVIKSAEIDATV